MTEKQIKERLETVEANVGKLWEAITDLAEEIPVGMKDSHLDLIDRQNYTREIVDSLVERINALENKGKRKS